MSERLASDKHSSLFCLFVVHKGKEVLNFYIFLASVVNVIQHVIFITDEEVKNKVLCLFLASFSDFV